MRISFLILILIGSYAKAEEFKITKEEYRQVLLQEAKAVQRISKLEARLNEVIDRLNSISQASQASEIANWPIPESHPWPVPKKSQCKSHWNGNQLIEECEEN